jgi:transposase-like protein
MTNPWVAALLGVLTLLLGGGSGAALFRLVAERRMRRVEVADRLSDSSLKWVQEFQEETRQSRLEAAEARREVAEVRRELAECRREAENLARDLRSLRGAILAPTATVERLRGLVEGTPNGRY